MGKQVNYLILYSAIFNFDNYHQAADDATNSEENTEYENTVKMPLEHLLLNNN